MTVPSDAPSIPTTPSPGLSPVSAPVREHLRPLSPLHWWLVLLAFAVIWMSGLGHRPLLSPDEGRYAEIGREMAVSGDFVTPMLNGLAYFEKPPLQAWVTALAFQAFGFDDAVVRAVPAIYGLLTCLLGWWTLRRLRLRPGENAAQREAIAQMALLISAALPWVMLNAHFVSLDMGLSFWLTLSLAGMVLWLDSWTGGSTAMVGFRSAGPRGAALMFWLGLAGGFLSKGLVGLVLPALAGAGVILLTLRGGALRHALGLLGWWPGWLLWAALCLPWLLLMESRNPGFLWFFFIHEHFLRYTTEVHRRVEPWWYFLPIMLVGLGPWLFHLLLGLFGQRVGPARSGPIDVLLLTWSAAILLFFSVSGSKLPSYVLPIFPALAWWLARRLPDLPARLHAFAHGGALVWSLLGIGLAALAGRWIGTADRIFYAQHQPWLIASFAAFAVGAALAFVLRRGSVVHPVLALALGACLGCQLAAAGYAAWGERGSARGLVARLAAVEDAEALRTAPIYSVTVYDQTLPFYLRRPVTLVDYRDEMGPGLDRAPDRMGPSAARLRETWAGLPPSLAFMDLDTLKAWRDAGLEPCVVARNARRFMVSNRPGAACLSDGPA